SRARCGHRLSRRMRLWLRHSCTGAYGGGGAAEVKPQGAWLVGIDIGAGSLKTMVVGRDGRVAGAASVEFATRAPHPGWSEQDPSDWWRGLCATVPRALAEARLPADAVAAVAFSAGAHTRVLEDASGNGLRPAILWSDQRSAAE